MNKLVAYSLGAVAAVVLLLAALFALSPSERPDDRIIAQVTMTPTAGDQEDTAEALATAQPTPTSDSPTVVEVPVVTPIPGPGGAPLLPPLHAVMEGGVGGSGQGGVPASPDTSYILNTVLSENPGRVPAYVQREPAPLTVSYVTQMAQRLGFDAQVYTPRPDIDDELPMYIAIDEPRRLWFHDAWLMYEDRGQPDYGYPPQGAPPLEQSVERATQWLESAGLLEAPFQIVATRETILFYRILGSGWMVSEPFARVTFSPDGQIRVASYEDFNLDKVGDYPIISAQEAWEILASGQPSGRVWHDLYGKADPLPWGEWGDWSRYNPRTWSREYAVGQRVHLFGKLETLYPVGEEDTLHVTMQGLILRGDLQPLSDAYQALVESTGLADVPIHVWGEVVPGDGKYLVLQVEGWQIEEWPDSALSIPYQWSGTIQRGEQDLLLADNDRIIPVADLPADLADGIGVFVTGGEVDGTLEWNSIQEKLVDGGMPGPAAQPAQVQATVEQVDLIYLIPRANYVPAEFDWGYRAPQPVWRFSGHTDQGYGFLVYVQAVEDAYLSPEP